MVLYASQRSAIVGTFMCLFQLMIGQVFMAIGANGEPVVYWLGAVWMFLFAMLIGRIWYFKLTNKPSYQADNDGFSVMGKRKRPWSDFHGAKVQSIGVYFIPVASWVVIKSGKGLFAPRLQIHIGHLSEKPKKMAERINGFANKQIAHGN